MAWKERFHALYRAEGLDLSAEAFAPVFYAADDALIGALPREASLTETTRVLAANLETELAQRRMGRPDRGRGERVASRFLSDADKVFARNRPVLECLGESYRLGIVSNFYGNLEGVCESAGLKPLFGALADSHVVGAEKPEPAIFRAALDTLDADPETTIFIGDSLRRDLEGARRLGMGFVWITPESARAAEAGAPPMRATVTSLSEIPGVLA